MGVFLSDIVLHLNKMYTYKMFLRLMVSGFMVPPLRQATSLPNTAHQIRHQYNQCENLVIPISSYCLKTQPFHWLSTIHYRQFHLIFQVMEPFYSNGWRTVVPTEHVYLPLLFPGSILNCYQRSIFMHAVSQSVSHKLHAIFQKHLNECLNHHHSGL